ncbi:mechanosensitive ion channel family protein [Methylobacillus flagellatus]|uniref:MscS Mechanosensitive ion channel n=1 Tax=Methylobacillus flagellatus (strain ATCC 51484 / DSM 6875 / VKM B-1610 / KT) TaxID=265072 RepID=Q1H4K9_METFK|nr:mechanosensitive ion channel domain-containing protein [Methylobacillus flagellatus]ABE48578.1 MscS Mechanosensitive ion channel [Methylobacillus flagellatus KT]
MNSTIFHVWQELANDFSSAAVLWQLAIIVSSLLLAWSINSMQRARLASSNAHYAAIGGITRVLFPISSLVMVLLGQLVIGHWYSTSLLALASRLLVAMVVIRLAVYVLRYVFAPSGWLRTTENVVSTAVWLVLVLHVTGLLPDMIEALDGIRFNIGKSTVSLWLVIQGLFTVLVTVFVALWLSRLIENKLMMATHIAINMRVVINKVIRITFVFFAVLVALSAVGLDITLLSVFGGALGVGLGFGLQKIASNYVSGFIILLDESMNLGDFVTIGSYYGSVQELRSRYMVLRQLDGTDVIIPNETLMTSAVVNHTATRRHVKIALPIQVGYETDLRATLELMKEVASRHPRVMKDPAPDAKLVGFGESAIDLNLTVWVPDPENGAGDVPSTVYLNLWDEFKARGISIPYPQREVHVFGHGVGIEEAKSGLNNGSAA